MSELFLAAFGIVLFLLLLQKLEHAETKLLIKTIKWTFVGILVLASVYLTLVGRLLHVAAIVVLLFILLKQDVRAWLRHKRPPIPLPAPMTRARAARLLKVGAKASPEAIEKAFESIEIKDSTHQDQLIQARDVLLGKK